jgi:hypothetical protein
MSDKTALERLNELFYLDLGQPPSEMELRLMGPFVRKVTEEKTVEVNNLVEEIERLIASTPQTNEQLREALTTMRTREAQLVDARQQLKSRLEILKEFGFDTGNWNT